MTLLSLSNHYDPVVKMFAQETMISSVLTETKNTATRRYQEYKELLEWLNDYRGKASMSAAESEGPDGPQSLDSSRKEWCPSPS